MLQDIRASGIRSTSGGGSGGGGGGSNCSNGNAPNGTNGSNCSHNGGTNTSSAATHYAGTLYGLTEAPLLKIVLARVAVDLAASGGGGEWRCVNAEQLRLEGNVTPVLHPTATCTLT